MEDTPQAPLPEAWGVLYAAPNPDGSTKQCQNCMMFSWDKKCSIHAKNVFVGPDFICGYHVFGKPMEKRMDHPGMQPVNPATSGLDQVPAGTVCGSCVFYEPTGPDEGVCWGVAKNGVPPQPVQFMGCCSRWETLEENEE